MSKVFRELLRKVGSGRHTGKDLSRQEAELATKMILEQEATPAQIGAFMIAHRIKRPTGVELAGMLDAYDQLGGRVEALDSEQTVLVLGSPYDGRSRTAPISPIASLILASAGCPTILHGGDRMPTKDGLPLIDIWQALGVNWQQLSLAQVRQVLSATNLGFVYLPKHFPLAQGIVPYRDQVGKRPPFATLELIWVPYLGKTLTVSGFVHPPTETNIREAFALRGVTEFATIKGLEGSVDLPRDRTAILGIHRGGTFERLTLSARDYNLQGKDVEIAEALEMSQMILSTLKGLPSEYMQSAIWNGGFYLWLSGISADLQSGLDRAKEILNTGIAERKLKDVKEAIAAFTAG
ncbi:anthranilate phosphoribosyltransferase family protein [Tumidithrix helvetica PCC 7403]|uniref:anthranilate phosphoribosyltransferase family protein n=1 Tax=Tumidithrix helvetica TaxID=3457545 RepID=UPI003C8F2094